MIHDYKSVELNMTLHIGDIVFSLTEIHYWSDRFINCHGTVYNGLPMVLVYDNSDHNWWMALERDWWSQEVAPECIGSIDSLAFIPIYVNMLMEIESEGQ